MSKLKSAVLAKNNLPANTNPAQMQKDSTQKEIGDNSALALTPPYDFTSLAELYDMNSYHSRCCKVKAGVTVLLGCTVFDPGDDKRSHDEEYQKIEKIINNSLTELYNVQLDHEIFGNGYIEVVRNSLNEVAELYHIPARDSVLVIRGNKLLLKQAIGSSEIYYKPFEGENYNVNDGRHEYLHLKNYNPKSRYYGAPDYIGSISAMYLDISANEYNTRRFMNNAVPDSIIKMYGFDQDSETENNIKTFFQGNFKGVDNAGKVLLLWADSKEGNEIEVEKMGAEIKEASFRGLRQDNREEVLAAHGVPARLAGVESAAKLSGGNETREQLKLFNEIIIIPKQNSLSRLLNKIIESAAGVKGWKIKFNRFEFANAADDASFYQVMVSSGILDADEARTELGYGIRK